LKDLFEKHYENQNYKKDYLEKIYC